MVIDLKGCQVSVLCEDNAHFRFIYGYLKCIGIQQRNIVRLTNVHNNAGVDREYPKAVTSYRNHGYKNKILVVMRNADEDTYHDRLRKFDRILDEEKFRLNQLTRLAEEKILIFCPVRNIESWCYFIDTQDNTGENLMKNGEVKDYKTKYQRDDYQSFGQKLYKDICSKRPIVPLPPSLQSACQELQRLEL